MSTLPAILGGTPLLREPSHLVRPELPNVAELLKGFDELETTRMFTNQGAFARRLEERIAAELDVEYCALFCNGTTAIMCLARALDLQGEVLLPSFTFPAAAQALCWQGITPRFVDIDPRTLMMDPQRTEEAVTAKTSAIFPANVFGGCCRYDAFEELSARHGLPLIFDSAQALGATYHGRPIGGFGDAEVLSFHATKVFHTAEGGAVVTSRRDLYERLCSIRNFGFGAYLNCTELGLNGKLDELSALLGLCLLGDLPVHLEARRQACSEYEQDLEGIPGLNQPEIDAAVTPSPAYFPLLVDSATFGLGNLELNYALMAEGIVSRCYFYPPVHRTTYYQDLLGPEVTDLPATDWAATSVLCLPLHSGLETRTIQAIVEGIRRCHRYASRIREALHGKIPMDWSPESMVAHRDPYDVFISRTSQPDPGDEIPKRQT